MDILNWRKVDDKVALFYKEPSYIRAIFCLLTARREYVKVVF